ncbi:hypothetical protein EI94DRAFT_751716 [Lactarius quietus]|nr:hypothetical protein EI94DRAFT_751716 [Lactarius quietus]
MCFPVWSCLKLHTMVRIAASIGRARYSIAISQAANDKNLLTRGLTDHFYIDDMPQPPFDFQASKISSRNGSLFRNGLRPLLWRHPGLVTRFRSKTDMIFPFLFQCTGRHFSPSDLHLRGGPAYKSLRATSSLSILVLLNIRQWLTIDNKRCGQLA